MSERGCFTVANGGRCGFDCPVLARGECIEPPVEGMLAEIERLGNEITTLKAELATAQAALAVVSPFFKAEDRP